MGLINIIMPSSTPLYAGVLINLKNEKYLGMPRTKPGAAGRKSANATSVLSLVPRLHNNKKIQLSHLVARFIFTTLDEANLISHLEALHLKLFDDNLFDDK